MISIRQRLMNTQLIGNYRKMYPYIRPYWVRAVLAVLITIPIGSFDALTAWILKPCMDVVLVEKQVHAVSLILLVIVIGSLLQSLCNYGATYLNTWVGQKITMGMRNTNVKLKLLPILSSYEREVPSMSKAKSLKNGKVSSDAPLKNSRSLIKGKSK